MNPDLMTAIVAESHRSPESAIDLLLEMQATRERIERESGL